MTIEHKLVVGLEEIKAIIFECAECKARIVLTPEQLNKPPDKCPRGHTWEWDVPEQHQSITGSPYFFFLTGLKKLREPVVNQLYGFRIFLEFEEPKN
jgi:hypothetical protein